MKIRATILLVLLFAFNVATLAQDEGVLTVDAGESAGAISPFVYGANYGPLGFISVDLFSLAEASGITFIRFPGGRWGDENNLRPFDIDMYMNVVRLIGAEPYIHVRLEGGTPEAAADLVRLTNIENDYNIRYWGIGNEPNLFDDYTTEDLNREWRAIAEAMLEVDPDITLIGPDLSQWNGTPQVDPVDPEGRDWLREFLLANGDMVDVVAVHRYPFPRSMTNPMTTIDELRNNVYEWSHTLNNLRAVILETTGRDDVPVAITEVNSHWSGNIGGEATNDSFYNAIWWADVLGRLIQGRPFAVNYFDLQSNSSRGGMGLLARYESRPTYYTYQLYQRFGSELLASESSDSDVSIYAARREDGALTLIVVNLSDEMQPRLLNIQNFDAETTSEHWLFDADHNAELIGSDVPLGDEISLPPQSISLYILSPG